MMSWKCSFFPALQSLQNQLPSGISMFRQSGWKAAGQDSQHSRLPPAQRAPFSPPPHPARLSPAAFPVYSSYPLTLRQ